MLAPAGAQRSPGHLAPPAVSSFSFRRPLTGVRDSVAAPPRVALRSTRG